METQKTITIFSGPVTAITIFLLLAGNIFFYLRGSAWGKTQEPEPVEQMMPFDLKAGALNTDDQAIFSFTGDTVLVQAPAKPINFKPAWNILYKDRYGIYQNEDVPEEMLDKIEPDSSEPDTK
jgi:hypothetical protein